MQSGYLRTYVVGITHLQLVVPSFFLMKLISSKESDFPDGMLQSKTGATIFAI